MTDGIGRNIDYMRVSVTGRCNLNCRYCMPDGVGCDGALSDDEIIKICEAAAELGISKIKLTGGEPLLRKNIVSLAERINSIQGIRQVTLTTNGILLEKYSDLLYESGIRNINVSLDTTDRKKYAEITGSDKLYEVFKGIDKAVDTGFKVKINSVLTEDNDDFLSLAMIAADKEIDVRFIEMMPMGNGKNFKGISNEDIYRGITKYIGKLKEDKEYHGNGPALYYRIDGFKGAIGFISAVHGKFCDKCNRIRLSSDGTLKGCLCYESDISVIGRKNYKELIRQVIEAKPTEHCFENYNGITEGRSMFRIGG